MNATKRTPRPKGGLTVTLNAGQAVHVLMPDGRRVTMTPKRTVTVNLQGPADCRFLRDCLEDKPAA